MSGEELSAIPVEELSDVASLKKRLRAKNGLPICLQDLVHEGRRLADAEKLQAPLDLQVILSLGRPVVPLFPFGGVLGSLINHPKKQKRAPFLILGYWAA